MSQWRRSDPPVPPNSDYSLGPRSEGDPRRAFYLSPLTGRSAAGEKPTKLGLALSVLEEAEFATLHCVAGFL